MTLLPIKTEDYYLEDPIDYSKIADRLIVDSKAKETKRAFGGDLKYFFTWSSVAIEQDEHFPVSEETAFKFVIQHLEPDAMPKQIEDFLIDKGVKAERGLHSFATVRRRLDTLSAYHKAKGETSPTQSQKLKSLLFAMRKKAAPQKKKKAVTIDILNDLLNSCGTSLIDVRDKAILLFAWSSGGRRRSETASAVFENLTELPDGDYTYRLGKTKTDQVGQGFDVPIRGRAAAALRDWLLTSEITEGSIFRSLTRKGETKVALTGQEVNRIVKKLARRAGYDENQFGAHSLRSGFVTQAGRSGRVLADVMSMTGHRSVTTCLGYFESGTALNNPCSDLAG